MATATTTAGTSADGSSNRMARLSMVQNSTPGILSGEEGCERAWCVCVLYFGHICRLIWLLPFDLFFM